MSRVWLVAVGTLTLLCFKANAKDSLLRRVPKWHQFCRAQLMPSYYFKLVDSTTITDYDVHDLLDETAAQNGATELARSLRESRPELLGRHLFISVTTAGICIVPLDHI